MAEQVCTIHGPYSGPTCPYCAPEQRPAAPLPLGGEDELPTDLNVGQGGAPMPQGAEGEEPTEIPAARAERGFLDADDDEATQLPVEPVEDVTQLEHAPIGAVGLLWVREGPRRGQLYKIKGGTTIGRKEGELLLDDPKVSSHHAKITIEEDEFMLWDFGSANGTWINGKRIRQATRLYENDLIKIGDTTFVLKLLDPKPKRRASPARKSRKSTKRSTKRSKTK